ncbi:MAG: DMT family transporter [Gammaproteobacteria bacterium]
MHTPSGNNGLGFILSLNTAFLWGILPIALKEIIVTMDAITLVWFRFLIAALVIGPYLYGRRRLPGLAAAGRPLVLLLLVAGIGLCGNYVLFSLSLNYLNAESTEAVIQLTSLFLLLGGVVVFHEPFDRLQKLGALLIVVGLGLFFNDRFKELFSAGSQLGFGVLLVVVASLTWVVYALLQKHLLRHFSSVQILFVVYLLSVLLLTPLAAPASVLELSPLQLWLLVFCCLNTLLAYGSFAEALAHWHASKVSAVLALAPLFTIAALQIVVWINPAYPYSDNLNNLSIFAAGILVTGSMAVALVPLLNRRFSTDRIVGD